MVFRNILFLIFTLYSCESNGIVLTQYPPSKVDIGSSQIISWKSPVVLDSVSIDLYQRSQFKQNLGQTNQNLNNFKWNVSPHSDLGDSYFIKITGKSNINGTAWVNTPTFSIVLNGMTSGTISIITIVSIIGILVLCVCCNTNNKKYSRLGNLNQPFVDNNIPVARATNGTYPTAVVHQPSAATYPPTVVVQPETRGYSGSSVAGAAAGGFAAGVIVDEMIHSGRHHHHHNSDFGGGGFFDGNNSAGGGGDSSWGFFSDSNNDSGSGGGDSSGGFF